MKEALVIVSFGTSVAEAQKDIDGVEAALAAAMPDADFFTALTSPTIRRKLKSRGEAAYSLEEILETLSPADYNRVTVQPTHLLYGIEYDRIKAVVSAYASRFAAITLGEPLLAGTEDMIALARCLKAEYGSDSEALVLMGHGTEHYANMVYPAFQTVLRLEGYANAYVGTVEGWPSLEPVIRQLKADNHQKILLMPMMLVAGDHARNDMAGSDPDSWKSRLEAEGFTVRCHMEGLGRLSQVQSLYVRHLNELTEGCSKM